MEIKLPITPTDGYILVSIVNKYKSGLTVADEKFAYVGEGYSPSLGKYVYFEGTPVSEIIELDEGRFLLIKITDIKGYKNE